MSDFAGKYTEENENFSFLHENYKYIYNRGWVWYNAYRIPEKTLDFRECGKDRQLGKEFLYGKSETFLYQY